MKYKCTFPNGGGTEYDGGIWEMKETNKTITFTCIKQPFFEVCWNKLKLNKDGQKNKHPFTCWKTGCYIIYPDQCGTPYTFEPIEELK
jgi:hypothetical protein